MSLAGVSQLFAQESSSRARVLVPYTPSLSRCKRSYMQFAYLGSLCLQVTQAKGVEVGEGGSTGTALWRRSKSTPI